MLTATTQDEGDKGTHPMRLFITMGMTEFPDEYAAYPVYETDFSLQIVAADCDCSLLEWVEPDQLSMLTKLMADPVATETIPLATIDPASKEAEPAVRSCYESTALCDETSTVVLVQTGSTLPAFMTFDADTSVMLLTVEPVVSSQIATYTLELTQTVMTGHDPIVFEPIVITVDCIIEEIRTPDALVDTTYHILSAAQPHTMTPMFAQWPPCDYVLAEAITWDMAGAPVTVDPADDYTITIESTDLEAHGEYTLVMTNTVSYTDDGEGLQEWAPSVSFVVSIKDPCQTATFYEVTVTDLTVVLGEAVEFPFSELVDTAEETYGLDSCGERLYTIVEAADPTFTPVAYARVEVVEADTSFKIVADPTDEADEGTHELALYTTMVNYPLSENGAYPSLPAPFTLEITVNPCDCSLLEWDLPEPQAATTSVKRAEVAELTILHATVNEASKSASPAIRTCYREDLGAPPGCDETTVITDVVEDGSTADPPLPTFITRDTDLLTIEPTDNAEARAYTIQVTHSLVDNDPITFSTVTITVEVCLLTHFLPPDDPSPVTYSVHALESTVVDLSAPGFVQQPACGYALAETFVWDIPSDIAGTIFGTGDYTLEVESYVNGDAGTWAVRLVDLIEYAAAGQSFPEEIAFDVEIIDPCLLTTIEDIVLETIAWPMETGQTVYNEFAEPADSAATAVNSPLICGPKTYSVAYQDGTAQDLVTIEAVTANTLHKLVATTSDEAQQMDHDLRLTVTLGDAAYPSQYVDFTLTISRAACDCSLLDWLPPEAQHLTTTVLKEESEFITINHWTVDEDSKAAFPAIRSCYGPEPATPCDETTVITAVVVDGDLCDPAPLLEVCGTLPAFFAWEAGSDVVTVNAADNAQSQSDPPYTLLVTHSTDAEGDLEIPTVTIAIEDCVITDLDPPTAPVDALYTIFQLDAYSIDISSPGFQQRPACGYTLVEDRTWTIPAAAPITEDGSDPYILAVASDVGTDRDIYTVTLANSALYETTGVTYANTVTFDIAVVDPCLASEANEIDAFSIEAVAIEAGLTNLATFAEATDTAAAAVSNPTICGARTYTVVEVVSGVEQEQSIVTYSEEEAGVSHTLTTTTQDEVNDVGPHSMRLKVSLGDELYPTRDVDFEVTILPPTCDCSLLEWDAPDAQTFTTSVLHIPSEVFTIAHYTVNEASKSASPKIRACYPDEACDETTAVTDVIEEGTTLPGIFAWESMSSDIEVNAGSLALTVEE